MQLVRKLTVYGCNSFEKRKTLQEFLETNGAIIEDYRFNFKECSVVFRFSLRVSLAELRTRLDSSQYGLDYEIVTPYSRLTF